MCHHQLVTTNTMSSLREQPCPTSGAVYASTHGVLAQRALLALLHALDRVPAGLAVQAVRSLHLPRCLLPRGALLTWDGKYNSALTTPVLMLQNTQ